MPTAILIDGGFFIKRYRAIHPSQNHQDPKIIAKGLYEMCLKHLEKMDGQNKRNLYRIFYYDCPPLSKKIHHPLTNRSIDLSKTPECIFRLNLHQELRKIRKLALRLGRLAVNGSWTLENHKLESLLRGKLKTEDLNMNNVIYCIRQKGVDMKLGLDIASLTYKKLVDQIILISGDSDFVPAAKLARREGIDFILDPLWNHTNLDLLEHIDGLWSVWPDPKRNKKTKEHEKSFSFGLCRAKRGASLDDMEKAIRKGSTEDTR